MHKKKRNRTLKLLPIAFILTGCSLTRVSSEAHTKDVNEMKMVGMSLDAARLKAAGQGFECTPGATLSSVQTDDGVHRWLQTECSKENLELICPQVRSIVLNVDPESQRVVAVGKSITPRACF